MRRILQKSKKDGNLRNIMNVSAIVIIATTAISWIGIMELNKRK